MLFCTFGRHIKLPDRFLLVMKDNLQKVPDFDDLLFEKRNKDYGAYLLRKKYNSVVITGTVIGSLIFALAVIIPFLLTPQNDHVIAGEARYVQVQMENLEIPKEELFVPPSPPPPEAKIMQEIVKYVPPVVVDSIITIEKTTATTDEALAQQSENQLEVTGNGNGDDILSSMDGTETDEPFVMVEIMPSFKGGDINKFREWVQKRTNYPKVAIDNKIQGRVMLTFIVESDGAVSNVTVLKGVDPLIDSEAVKAIEASPKWSPGLQRGKPVRVRYSMWLNFLI